MPWLKLKARTRISLGLVCMLLSVLSTAMLLGLVPEQETATRRGRATLCETVALVGTEYISRGSTHQVEKLLAAMVERNDELISAAVRRGDGRSIAFFGPHPSHWTSRTAKDSPETHVEIPLRRGKTRWGAIELVFVPTHGGSWVAAASPPWVAMTGFICVACFLLFQLYLKKMLAHLDPGRSVPKRVRTALDSLAEGLLVMDRQGRIVLANQSFADWIECDPEQLLGKKADSLQWKLGNIELSPWWDAITHETVVAGAMIELGLSGDRTRTLIANASPVIGQEGKCRGVLVSFDDVTQLEETKRDLTIAKRAADQANQAKSEFLARMSHEIRTPMNAILGYTDVLRRGFDASIEDRQDYLDTIHSSGEHLLALINDILDLSKVESGQLQLESGMCSPYRIAKDVVALLRSKADEKGIDFGMRCEGLLPRTILGDSVRLRQAIVNLAGNAIKFTDRGGVEIVLRMASDSDAPTALLAIDVIDTGIGIPEEAQAKIFEPFAQADTSITRRFGGTGLGLAISKQLAEAMGGGISLHSVPGKGTTFTLTFRVGDPKQLEWIDPTSETDRRAPTAVVADSTKQLPACKILVADDGVPNRKLVKLVLGQAGADVVTVANGREAVEAVERESFDAILMDMQMPVMDGYRATEHLRRSGYRRPIIALTAAAMQGDEEKCRAAGCSGFVAKPIKIDQLLESLADALQHADTPQQNARSQPTGVQQPTGAQQSDTTQPAPQQKPIAETASGDSASPIRCSYPLDDPDFLEIAVEFVAALGERLPKLATAFAEKRFDALATDAHWLKGVSGSAGFDAFVEPASRLQAAAEANEESICEALLKDIHRMARRIDLPGGIADSPVPDVNGPATESDEGLTSIGDIAANDQS